MDISDGQGNFLHVGQYKCITLLHVSIVQLFRKVSVGVCVFDSPSSAVDGPCVRVDSPDRPLGHSSSPMTMPHCWGQGDGPSAQHPVSQVQVGQLQGQENTQQQRIRNATVFIIGTLTAKS